jgi:hypothetical protein
VPTTFNGATFNGDVGIGTTIPEAQLHIGPKNNDHIYLASSNNDYGWKIDTEDQSAGDVPFRIIKRLNDVDTTVLTIKNQDGNVGIGTVSPTDKLHVNGSLLIQHDTIYDTSSTAGWYKIGVWDPTGNNGARLKIRFLGMEGYSAQTPARGGETILYASCNNNNPSTVANMTGIIHAHGPPAITEVKFVHLDSSRHKFEIRAYVKTFVKMSMSVECNQTDSFTKFFTASSDAGVDSATVGSALFSHVFDNSGNVGIGMIDPGAKLDVNGSIRGAYDTDTTSYFGRSAVGYVGHSDWAGLAHLDCNNSTDYCLLQNNTGITELNCKSDKYIQFNCGNAAKMRMTADGDFGIGDTTPSSKLDVNGSIRGAYDTDTTSYFGRSAVGYVGHSDWAGLAHIDRNNGSDYALLHNSAGRTIINSKSDQRISFSSGDNETMCVKGSDVGIGTSDPDEKLHVNGIVKATNLDLDGNVVRSAANITLAANSWAKIADFAGLVTGGHYLISIKWDNSALVGGGTAIWNGGVTYSTYVIGTASVYNTTGDELIKYNAHYHYRTISAFEFVQDSDSSSGNYGQHSIYMKSPQSAIVASGVSVTAYRIG